MMRFFNIKFIFILLVIAIATTTPAYANPLKCSAKEPLLCRKAIIEILRKAGLNTYFIEDGDIILTADISSAQYAGIKNTPLGIFVHEYDGVKVNTRQLTIEDVVGFESADSALKGHHPRYGLNVLTTLATSGSFAQSMPQLVNAQLPGQTKPGPIKVTIVISKGTSSEKTVEFILRKNDKSTALGGMQSLGLLDKDLNLVLGKLNTDNKYTLSADALAKLVGMPVSSLQSADKTTFEYSFSAASDDDIKRDSLDVTRTPAGVAQLVLAKPTPPTLVTVPTLVAEQAVKPGATPGEQALLDASNVLGVYTGVKYSEKDKYQKLIQVETILGKGAVSNEQAVIQHIDQVKKVVALAGGMDKLAEWGSWQSTGDPRLTAYQKSLIQAFQINVKRAGTEIRNSVLGQGRGDELHAANDKLSTQYMEATYENKYRQAAYQQQLDAFKVFQEKQKQIAGSGADTRGPKFYAIDGESSYASANEFLKAHGQVNTKTGNVKSFNELTKATPNPNHGGSLGYMHFGGSPEFLTSKGNPTPKPYWVHEYVCQDATCSSYTAINTKTIQSSDQGRLFRLDQYSGPTRQRLENLIMNGNLDGADPNGRLVQQIGSRLFVFEPLHKDPASTWEPALLHSFNQAASGKGVQPAIPADMSGFSVGYQVCGPNGCLGVNEKSGQLSAPGVVTQLGAIVEQGSLLKSLQSLAAVGANGQIKGIGTDKDGKIIVFTQVPGDSDLIKFTFSRLSPDQVAAAGLRPISKPVPLLTESPNPKNSGNTQIFTITVSDKNGGRTASRFPGIVTQDKVNTLIDAGVIKPQNGQFVIQGTKNPDGTITAPVLLEGTQYSFTFHPGIYVGSSSMPNAVTQALNQQQVTKFFNPNTAQSATVSSLTPLGQTGNSQGAASGNQKAKQAQQNVAHVHAQRTKAVTGALSNTVNGGLSVSQGNGKLPKAELKPRSTITFAHNLAPPNTHVDATNVNQYFVTPSAGHQIELNEAPKFVDSDNKQWLCMISGLGHRIAISSDGRKTVHGHAETLSFIDNAVRDIPGAMHGTSSNCLISINHE